MTSYINNDKLLSELQVHKIELNEQFAELQRVNSELSNRINHYETLYKLVQYGLITVHLLTGEILEINKLALELTGNEFLNKVIGKHFTTLITEKYFDVWHSFAIGSLEEGWKETINVVLKNKQTPVKLECCRSRENLLIIIKAI